MTQNNKGIAFKKLPDGDRGAQLREAIACYDAALTVRTRDAFPQQWAMTQFNKSLLFVALQDWQQALTCIEAAIGGFRLVGHIHYLQGAEQNKRDIEDVMRDEAAE
jgi:tetratricopeptide (TPR) repeat protein